MRKHLSRFLLLLLAGACILSMAACGAEPISAASSKARSEDEDEEERLEDRESEGNEPVSAESEAPGEAEEQDDGASDHSGSSLFGALGDKAEAPEDAGSPEEPEADTLPEIIFEHFTSPNEYAVITAFRADGSKVWSYTTASYDLFQVDHVTDIGLFDSRYYFVEDKDVCCLNAYDGSMLWVNEDYESYMAEGGFAFDRDGTLYIAGWIGNDLTVIDKNGTTQMRIPSFDSCFYNPYEVILDGTDLFITYEMGNDGMPHTLVVSTVDYTWHEQ